MDSNHKFRIFSIKKIMYFKKLHILLKITYLYTYTTYYLFLHHWQWKWEDSRSKPFRNVTDHWVSGTLSKLVIFLLLLHMTRCPWKICYESYTFWHMDAEKYGFLFSNCFYILLSNDLFLNTPAWSKTFNYVSTS